MHRSPVRWRALAAVVLCLAVAAVVAACGSSNNSSSGSSSTPAAAASTSPAAATTASSSDPGMAEAQRIVTAAESTAAYAPAAKGLTADQISAATPDDVAKDIVPYKPTGGPKKKVILIACASISVTCTHQVELAAAALNLTGDFDAKAVPAGNDYSVQSYQRSFTNAIQQKPYAIVTTGMPGAAVGAQLAAAKKAGIFTVGGNVDVESGAGYDAYIASGYNIGAATVAAYMAATYGPKGSIYWYDTPQFPFLNVQAGLTLLKTLCPDCKVASSGVDAAKQIDPVQLAGLTTAAIQSHPNLDALAWAGDEIFGPVKRAIDGSNQPKVETVTQSFNSATAANLKAGDIPVMMGTPSLWQGMQLADAVLRKASGKPALAEDEYKIGALIMKPDEVPAGKLDETAIDKYVLSKFPLLDVYGKAWNIPLNTIIK